MSPRVCVCMYRQQVNRQKEILWGLYQAVRTYILLAHAVWGTKSTYFQVYTCCLYKIYIILAKTPFVKAWQVQVIITSWFIKTQPSAPPFHRETYKDKLDLPPVVAAVQTAEEPRDVGREKKLSIAENKTNSNYL